MSYTLGNPPQSGDVAALKRYVQAEFLKISLELQPKSQSKNVLHVEPTRPFEGLIVLADGTDWNPGQGKGFYGYHSGTWHKLDT